MRILHAYRDLLIKGGRPQEARALICALSRAGIPSAIVSRTVPEDANCLAAEDDIPVYDVSPGARGHAAFCEAVQHFQPDLVHLSGGPRIFSHSLWAYELRRRGIPYILSGCGNIDALSYLHRWGGKTNTRLTSASRWLYFHLFDRFLIRHAAAVHGASLYEAELAVRLGARSTFVAPFGTYPEWIAPSPLQRSVHSPVTFVYLGRLSIFHKGLDLVVEAFGKVVQAGLGDRFRIIFAGTTECNSMETLRKRASALGVTIEFSGGVWGAEKDALWDQADYYLHMCRFNGFALAAREALCKGLPLITTRESDMGDWVAQHDMGRVSPLDTDALAQTLMDVLQASPATYKQMSCQALKFAQTHTWADVAPAFIKAYGAVLRGIPPANALHHDALRAPYAAA
jgi:glycosyltransferase involved in cell wall biosynthesis